MGRFSLTPIMYFVEVAVTVAKALAATEREVEQDDNGEANADYGEKVDIFARFIKAYSEDAHHNCEIYEQQRGNNDVFRRGFHCWSCSAVGSGSTT